MALLKHTWTSTVRSDVGVGITDSTVYQADAEGNLTDVALAGATKQINLTVDVSQVKSFFVEADQDVTLKTNSSSSPSQTFTLVAKKALSWNLDRHDANPLTVDITALYFVNAGTVDANIKGSFLQDLGV